MGQGEGSFVRVGLVASGDVSKDKSRDRRLRVFTSWGGGREEGELLFRL